MKQYVVEITDEALSDMDQLYDHIARVLLAPENAMGQYNRIADEILKLDIFPERFQIMNSEPEHSKLGNIVITFLWQYFGSQKSVSQNKLRNRSKKVAFLQRNLHKII